MKPLAIFAGVDEAVFQTAVAGYCHCQIPFVRRYAPACRWSRFQTLPGSGQTSFPRRNALAKRRFHWVNTAGETSRTHDDFFRQLIHAEVGGGFSSKPCQQIVNRARGGSLPKVAGSKLAAGLRATRRCMTKSRRYRAVLKPQSSNQRQRKIKAGTDPARGPDTFVLNIESGPPSTRTSGNSACMVSSSFQWVVARLPSSSPVCASSIAPPQNGSNTAGMGKRAAASQPPQSLPAGFNLCRYDDRIEAREGLSLRRR